MSNWAGRRKHSSSGRLAPYIIVEKSEGNVVVRPLFHPVVFEKDLIHEKRKNIDKQHNPLRKRVKMDGWMDG